MIGSVSVVGAGEVFFPIAPPPPTPLCELVVVAEESLFPRLLMLVVGGLAPLRVDSFSPCISSDSSLPSPRMAAKEGADRDLCTWEGVRTYNQVVYHSLYYHSRAKTDQPTSAYPSYLLPQPTNLTPTYLCTEGSTRGVVAA